ncbi:vesicular glutamate transporter 1 [Elysia marginata]|uniref:Vesicular glutamate transporter 1 n=1 Tax=Elysia marginata TaxID=1093978 RepID=A0AAV4GWD8_9GAST|nr:vesicular glutamate transporter 1 [Elysia marginata]
MANMFFQRVNFSVAIVCMVNQTAISSHRNDPGSTWTSVVADNSSSVGQSLAIIKSQYNTSRPTSSSSTQQGTENSEDLNKCSSEALKKDEQEDGPFAWTKQEQGLLLGAIYWTYFLSVVPANHVLRNIRRKTVVTVAMGGMIATTLLLHGAALWSLWAVFVLKLIQGACTAVAMIAMYGMWTVWGPPHEMGKLLGFNLSGQMFSNVVVFPISALLCKYGFLGGWPSVFYVFGLISAVWLILFIIFVAETPSESRYITEEEKNYIVSSRANLGAGIQAVKTPWKSILTSRVMWSICCAQVSFAWNYFTFLATLPQYMHEVLKMDIESNGMYSMLPYIVMFITTYSSGPISDCVIRRSWVRVVWARRISVIFANSVPAVCLIALSYLDCTQSGLAIALLVLGVGTAGFSLSAFQLVPYDVAARFAPPMMTFSTTFATLTGLVTPYVVASIAKDQTREQWQVVLFLTSAILIFGSLGFCVLFNGEVPKWAAVESGLNMDIEIEEGTSGEKQPKQNNEADDDVGRKQLLITYTGPSESGKL